MDDHRVFSSIEPIERAWSALAEETAASLFLWPGWINAWVEAFGGEGLRVHTVWRDGYLVGVMPLIEGRSGLASAANWHSPRSGPIALDADAAAALARVAASGRPRRIDLRHLRDDDPAATAYISGLRAEGFLSLPARDHMRPPFSTLGDSWEEFESRLGKNRRKWLRKMDRRLAEAGTVSIEVHEGGPGLDERLLEGFAVEGSGWKGRDGTSINANESLRTLLTSVVTWAAERGMVRLLFLRLDGRPLAFDLMLVHQGVIYALKGGYDEEFRSFGPSMVSMREIILYGIRSGVHTIEWLGDAGTDEYKVEWSDGERGISTQQLVAPTLRGRGEWAARHAWRWGKDRLGAAVPADAQRRWSESTAALSRRFRGVQKAT